jgi:carbon-monoxide dehydrogenase small subunit
MMDHEPNVYAVDLVLNGDRQVVEVPPDERLLHTLRQRFHLFSARYGCGTGHCGACVVLVNDQPVPSCLVLTVRLDKQTVSTVEGLDKDAVMQELNHAFATENAAQCGYCSPGMLLSARALLKRNRQATDEDVREMMMSHMCRCTGYYAPLRAIEKVRDAHAVD